MSHFLHTLQFILALTLSFAIGAGLTYVGIKLGYIK